MSQKPTSSAGTDRVAIRKRILALKLLGLNNHAVGRCLKINESTVRPVMSRYGAKCMKVGSADSVDKKKVWKTWKVLRTVCNIISETAAKFLLLISVTKGRLFGS